MLPDDDKHVKMLYEFAFFAREKISGTKIMQLIEKNVKDFKIVNNMYLTFKHNAEIYT